MTNKSLVILLCITSGLTGLFMSGCGGYFFYWHVVSPGTEFSDPSVSVPSLLVGLVLMALAISGVVRARRNAREGKEPQSSLLMGILLTLVGAALSLVGLLFQLLLIPGAAILWAGIAGIMNATSRKPGREQTISGIPETQSTTDPSDESREETPR